MNCSRCHQSVPLPANFCPACGAEIPPEHSPSDSTTAAIELGELDPHHEVDELPPLEPGTGMLVVVRGPNAGSRFLLDRERTTVGRHPDSDIFLDDVTVSRRHAVIAQESGGLILEDQGSLNGSYVQGERVERRMLATGEEVQIGRFKLLYVGESPGAA